MSEDFEALLVERKAVKYWRTEYLRVQRERDEAHAALRKLAGTVETGKTADEVRNLAKRTLSAAPPQREGDYL